MARFILAIISTLLEEAALVVIVLFGLPRLGIQLPIPALIGLMVAWGAYSIFTYRMGSRALRKKPLISLPEMAGSRGKVVSALAPEGLVRIRGELWVARADGGEMNPGDEVIVLGQDGLKLLVRARGTDGDDSENVDSQRSG